jgi:intracellular sulfur oxidation DsrE/DsrF family protein
MGTTLVPGFGSIKPVPNAADLPEPNTRYRVIFTVSRTAETLTKVNASLEKVARFVNLLGSQRIVPAAGDLQVVVFGPATPLVLTDEAYRARFGTTNPNLPLIRELTKVGVQVHVCGQALHAQKIETVAVSPEVVTDLSAMTTIATLELKGWVLMPE